MRTVRRLAFALRVSAIAAVVAGVTACPSGTERNRRDSTAAPPAAGSATEGPGAEPPLQWDSAAGPALLLALDSLSDSAAAVRPEYMEGRYSDTSTIDLRALARTRFDLFGRSGAFGAVTVAPPSSQPPRGAVRAGNGTPGTQGSCLFWPTVGISGAKHGWRVALQSGYASATPLDSIEALPPSDSALFAVQVSRLAAMVPDTHDHVFDNVAFVVRSAYRFRTPFIDGVVVFTQRSIPSEATPREEHLFFVAERPVGSSDDYRIAFSTRTAGEEGGAAIMNVLALVTLARGERPALLVNHEYEDGGAVTVIERLAPGRWGIIWRSAYTGC